MRLGKKQELFARLHPRLTDEAHRQGFDIRFGELQRFDQQAEYNATHCRKCKKTKGHTNHRTHRFRSIGIRNTVHKLKLAQDYNLVKNGRLCSADKYTALGEWWEKQHKLCRWGGRFSDAGHFSLEHQGRK